MSGVTLAEVVKAQVAYLFGKFRPPTSLSAEETNAIRAERVEFSDRLIAFLRAIDAPEPRIVQEVRAVARDLFNDSSYTKMPTPEQVSSRVKAAFAVRARPTCFGCTDMGGRYEVAGDDAPLKEKQIGEFEYPGHGFLCSSHHHPVHWYAHREAVRRGVTGPCGTPFVMEYPPPSELLPSGVVPRSAPAADPKWASYTDGHNMGPLARWAREYVKRRHGWLVGETEAPLLEGAEPTRDAWRDL